MSKIQEDGASFVGYEYKEVSVKGRNTSLYLDGYQNFGWELDERTQEDALRGRGSLRLKRDRKIINKMELTRLQRHFEACMDELEALEQSKTSKASILSILVGLTGTVFLAGATFAAVHVPPLVLLSAVLAVPGFIGWITPVFLYRSLVRRRTKVVNELMEQKYDEIYEICQKGHDLLI